MTTSKQRHQLHRAARRRHLKAALKEQALRAYHVTSLPIPPKDWGRDHISTFAYAMACVHTNRGRVERPRMRVGSHRPGLRHLPADAYGGEGEYPTRLRDGREVYGHDDYDCLDDIAAAGYFKVHNTGVNPGVVTDVSEKAYEWHKRIVAAETAGKKWSETWP